MFGSKNGFTMADEDGSIQALCDKLEANDPSFTGLEIILDIFSDDEIELIAQAMRNNATLEKLEISIEFHEYTLSRAAAYSLEHAFISHPSLEHVTFHNLEFEEFSPIALAFRNNEKLSGLCFQYASVSVDDKVESDLKLLLKNNALCQLQFQNMHDWEDDYRTLDLSGALKNNDSLVELSLTENATISEETEQEIIHMLRRNQNLESITLDDVFSSEVNVARVISAAQGHKSLREFNLFEIDNKYQNMFFDIGYMTTLAPALRSLHLEGCNMCYKDLQALFEGLSSESCMITKLDLSHVRPGEDDSDWRDSSALGAIVDFLKRNRKLKSLSLSENGIGQADGDAPLLSVALENTCLECLDLSDNEIGPNAAADICTALDNNVSLKKLDLSENLLEKDGIEQVFEALKTNTTLETLTIGDGRNCIKEFDAIVTRLPGMRGLRKLSFCASGVQCLPTTETIDDMTARIERHNTTLEHFEFPSKKDSDRTRLDFVLKLNQAGRRMLQCPNAPTALWPLVLGRSSHSPDAIYSFLREKPELCRRERVVLSNCEEERSRMETKMQWSRMINGAYGAAERILFRISGRKRKREE